MCGILGAFPPVDEALFRAALDQLAHRGPDGEATWRHPEGRITLGHRRLAIIDLSESGAQPMQRGALTITCNGEFYNYREIRHRLAALGHHFQGESDTEVFLAAWAQWGPRALDECNGMWAFGMWDEHHQSLVLARDRFGKKPLYYLQKGDSLFFASEMKALFPFLDTVRPAGNFREMAAQLRDYESTADCLVEGIRRFPAGHWGEFKDGKLALHRYWDTLDHLEEPPPTFSGQVDRFRELFGDACRLRMRADVPLGTALSGGLDSGAVLSMVAMQRQDQGIQRGFTAGFPGTPFDESEKAALLAGSHSLPLELIPIHPPEPAELRRQLRLFGELHDTCPSPMMAVYERMRATGVLVSLDGHGADESMAGYGEGLFHAFGDCGGSISGVRSILDAFNHFYPADHHFPKKKADWKTFLAYRLRGGRELPPVLVQRLGHHGAYLHVLFHRTVFPVMLRNYDRFSMAHGVEVRMPFADHRLVSYLFSLPWDSKIRKGFTKAVLREAMAGLVPDGIRLQREKTGFTAPMAEWIRGPWGDFLDDLSASRWFRESDLGDGEALRRELMGFRAGRDADYFSGMRMWGLLAPFLWEWAVLRKE